MSDSSGVYIAQFGHPLLRGARHWAIMIMHDPDALAGTAYQISGGTETYEIKEPEHTDLLKTPTYMGCVLVGRVDRNKIEGNHNSLKKILDNTPVTLGDVNWNCQNWVFEGLRRLKAAGHAVDDLSLERLQELVQGSRREDGKWD